MNPGGLMHLRCIEKCGPFLKVWSQNDRNTFMYLEQKLNQLVAQLEQDLTLRPALENVHVGMMCCAKYKDNNYYRVQITNTSLLNQNLVEVHFIDYGNNDLVPFTNLRMLSTIAHNLTMIPQQAQDFILANVTFPGSAWNPQTLKILNDDLALLDMQYFIVGQNSGVTFIKLYLNSEDVLMKYFNSGLILSIASNAQYMIVQNMMTSQNSLKMSPRQLEAPHVSPFSPIAQTPPTFATYKTMTLEPNIDHQVYISYVSDGPCQFYVQLQNFETNLARLMNDLNRMTLEPLEEDPLPGTVCVARCLEDLHICRAVVTNMVDGKYKVFFVDFGNTESIPIDNIYKIPFKYLLPRVLAVRYSLSSIENSNITLEMKCAFKDFVSDKLLVMRSYAPRGRTAISQCDLWDSNKVNVIDILRQAALLAYPNVPQLTRGSNHEVKVSFVLSCSRFYVQISSKLEELRNLMENLQVQCPLTQNVSLAKLKVGSPCNALFNVDEQWYRAQVVGIAQDAVKVKYVDYGNEELVSIENIKAPIYELLTALKPQAIECCLNGYQNMSDESERDSILEELILEKDFSMKVVELFGPKVLVDLIDVDKYNVGSLILERIANSRSHVSPPILIQEDLNYDLRKQISPSSDQKFLRKPTRDNNEQEASDSWRQNKMQSEAITEKQESWRQNKPSRKETWNEGSNKRNDADTDRSPKGYDNGFNRRSESYDKDNSRRSKREERGKEYSPSSRGVRSPSFSRDNDRRRDRNEKNWRHNDKGDFSNDAKPRRPDSNSRRGYSPAPSNKSDNYKQSSPTIPSDNYKQSRNVQLSNPVLYTTPYNSHELENQSVNVSVCWFHNPSHFYCQLNDKQAEFELMMNEIQNTYSDIKPEKNVPVGSSVIALFPEDNILYRARILNSQGSQYRVQYIDFGNVSTTDKVWPVEKKFMDLPAQAVYCCLNGILPCDTDWPDADVYSTYFNKEYFTCNIIYKENDQHKVDLICDEQYVNQMLVEANLARYEDVGPTIELSILLGQQIRVLLLDVQSLDSIFVQLEMGCIISCSMHNLGTAKDCHEQTLKDNINNDLIMYVDNVLETQLEVTFYDLMGSKLQIVEPDEGAFSSIEPICMFPVYYPNITGRVVYFTEAKGKYQLCLQFDENLDAINHLLDSLFTHYNDSVIQTPVIPEVGTIYAVLSSDTNWYRGEVISIENESTNILFIDYGNSENVEIQNLRILDDQFKSQHMLCLNVLTSTFVDGQILEQEITGEIYYEDSWEMVLYTIAGIPVEAAPVENQITTEVVPESVPGSEEPAPEESLSKGYSVILSHFDTPNEFYLQFTNEIDKIEDLLSTIQEQVNEWPNLDNPAAGIICAAPFSVDQQWYRALILDADSDITTVRFLDYGNTDVIDNSVTVLKTLPSDMLAITQYAQRYSLLVKPTDVEWSQTVCEKFEELTKSDYLFVDIQHQDEKYTYVELYSNEVNVADALLQEKLVQKFEIETSKSGYLSHLNSPSEFWIQFENTVADLEWVADQLASVDKFPEVEDMTPGSLCVALFPDDEMWYRARILSNTVAGIEVLFIDYGNSCLCTGLKQLPEDMIMLPPLAQKCSLQKPNGILQWSDRAIEEFKTLSADGATVFNIHKISTGETSVVKLLLEGEDIISKLLPITEDSYIIHFESISSFWIHLTSNEEKLEAISKLLELAPELPNYEDNQVSSDIVVALFPDDEQWYRAKIVNVNESEYEVLFIDYGNGSIVSDVRIASDEIKQEQPLAYLCNVEPLPGFCWVEGSSLALSDISNNGDTVFQVEFVNKNVVRLYINGSDVRTQLPSETLSSAHNTPKKRAVKPVNDELNLDEINHVIDEIIDSVPIETDESTKQLIYSNIVDDQEPTNTCTDDIQDLANIQEDVPNIDETTAANDVNEEVVHEITGTVSDVDVLQDDITNTFGNDASEVVVTEIMEDLISVDVSNQDKFATDELASDSEEVVESEVIKDLVVSSEVSNQDQLTIDELASDPEEVVESEVIKDLVVSSEVSNQDQLATDELASDINKVVESEVIKDLVVSSEVSNQDQLTTDELASDIIKVVESEVLEDLVVSSEVSNEDQLTTDELASDINKVVESEVIKDLVISSEVSNEDQLTTDELASDINKVVESEVIKDLVVCSEVSNEDQLTTDELASDINKVVESEVIKDLVVSSEVSNEDQLTTDELVSDINKVVESEVTKDLVVSSEVLNQDQLTTDELARDINKVVESEVLKDLVVSSEISNQDQVTNDELVSDPEEVVESEVIKDLEVSSEVLNQDNVSTDELASDPEEVVESEVIKDSVVSSEVLNQDNVTTDELASDPEEVVESEVTKDLVVSSEVSNQDIVITDELASDPEEVVESEVIKDLVVPSEVANQDDSISNKLTNDSIEADFLTPLKDIIDVEVSRLDQSTNDVENVDSFDEVVHVLDIEEGVDVDVAHQDNPTNDSLVLGALEDISNIAKDIDESKQDTSTPDSLINDENEKVLREKENLDHDGSQVQVDDVIATVVPENIEELKDTELAKQEESTTDSLHNDEVENVASAIIEDFLDIEISKQDESYFNKLYNDEIQDVPVVKSNFPVTDEVTQEAIITDNGTLINEGKSCGTKIKEQVGEQQEISPSTGKPSNEIDQTPKLHSEKIVLESISKGDLSEIKSNEQV